MSKQSEKAHLASFAGDVAGAGGGAGRCGLGPGWLQHRSGPWSRVNANSMPLADFVECVATGGDDTHTHDNGTDPVTPVTPGTDMPAAGDMITSDSSSGGGAPEFQVVIDSLPMTLPVGSSIVLYLEDDYQEPTTIPQSSVYFVAERPTSEKTGNGARVYTTNAPKVDNDAYFDADKSDISIRVFIPDMCTSSTVECQGAYGVTRGQKLTMVVEDGSGIKNPTEAGSHSAAFKILLPTDSLPGPAAVNKDFELETVAEIALSDVDNSRGYELTVTGSGFNNGTTATAWVLGRAPPPQSGGTRWIAPR